MEPANPGNDVEILINGEEKFKSLLESLRQAVHHIHIEYYIYEDDEIGNQIKDILIQKAKAGVQVRYIYDDFGSRSVRKKLVPALKAAGAEAYPFYKVVFWALANRLNYRNHRKIVIIDGNLAFTGGINVSDRYINGPEKHQRFWRDTHVRSDGPGATYLQFLFIGDWNFCSGQRLDITPDFFHFAGKEKQEGATLQVIASGPDSENASIMLSLLQAISLAKKEILITTPYFIPGESLLDALTVSALSGIGVKLLVPEKSDSLLVGWAASSYYAEVMRSGVEVFQYKKGFVHAKTMVIDAEFAVIGTANMDYRSFDLNFEVNAMVYHAGAARKLQQAFYQDLDNAEQINPDAWNARPLARQLPEKLARLMSPLL